MSTEPEIVLYDLACTKGVCFSPVVWRIRLMLNYKKVPYRTIFLEFPDIEPTIKGLGIAPSSSSPPNPKYTVPVIHHLPSNTHIMDSLPISEFLETTYPHPALAPPSPASHDIETRARAALALPLRTSLAPRELRILSPPAQSHFRRTREAALGHRLEDLLGGEERVWAGAEAGVRAVGEAMLARAAGGPFVMGAGPGAIDFFVAASLQCARVVDEAVFRRVTGYPGYGGVYRACLPYMERKD